MTDVDVVVAELMPKIEKWAKNLYYDRWEDVFQEGMVGVVHACHIHPGRGDIFSYAARTGYLNMKKYSSKLMYGDTYDVKLKCFKNKEVVVDPPLYEDSFWGVDTTALSAIGYHTEEIRAAVATLPDKQREYVFHRFWLDASESELQQLTGSAQPRYLWNRKGAAKETLQAKLSHLEGVEDV